MDLYVLDASISETKKDFEILWTEKTLVSCDVFVTPYLRENYGVGTNILRLFYSSVKSRK